MGKNTLLTKRNRIIGNQRGFTLIEVAIVVALAAVLLGSLKIVPEIMAGNRANSEIAQIPRVIANVQKQFYNSANFSTIANTIVNQFKLVPDEMNGGGSIINNRWGGTVTFTPSGANSTRFTMTYTNVPESECQKILMAVGGNYLDAGANSTSILDASHKVDQTKVASQCQSTQNSIFFEAGK